MRIGRPWRLWSLLRARGGISIITREMHTSTTSSPRTRRYFQNTPINVGHIQLFSAHAEVFPTNSP